MLQHTTKQAGQFIKREDIGNAIAPAQATAPEHQPGPIQQELQELRDALEVLEKQHFILSDKLRTIYPADALTVNKQADGVAIEPTTGCELQDRIAFLTQQALYIQRLNTNLMEKLWI